MKQSGDFILKDNVKLTENVFKATFEGDIRAVDVPGQFVNILVKGFYLRRPLSVYECDEKSFSVIYKVVGDGTKQLSEASIGEKFNILCGLGNGYSLEGTKPVLVGGGCGIPPMYYLAEELIKKGSKPTVIMGFNTKSEVFCEEDFKKLGIDVKVTTADGSYGIKGFAVAAMEDTDYDYVYCCGPIPMLKSVFDKSHAEGQYSFEERMACGFGACMGCSCKTKYGNKRICTDGPVLKSDEIIWD